MILSILDFFTYNFFLDLCTFYVSQKMNVLPQFFYGMVVIGSLSMVGDGGGCEGCWGRWEGVGRVLGGRWEGVGRALGGRWEGVGRASCEGRPGSLIYRQIKSLHCSGYLLVIYILPSLVFNNLAGSHM